MRHAIALAALAALAVASAATACDKHATGKAAESGHAAKGCCAKKASATTARATGADEAALPAATDGATAPAGMKDCPMAAARAAADKASGAKCIDAPGTPFKASGKVVCARCELKKAEQCQSVFQAAGSADYVALCGEGMSADLLKVTRHGELEVNVTGQIKKTDAGGRVLCVEGFSVGKI